MEGGREREREILSMFISFSLEVGEKHRHSESSFSIFYYAIPSVSIRYGD